jgi:uncharacterized DUF497 family protein
MEITFDPAKDASNIRKHGVFLVLASEIGYAVIQDRLYCVVFPQRGESMHIISLRKANRREVRDVQES